MTQDLFTSSTSSSPKSFLPAMPAHPNFFINYNRIDQTWAEWIAWQLETEGY
jgi:hypothetical protein